jgi:flagellar biogenesis protein FliO
MKISADGAGRGWAGWLLGRLLGGEKQARRLEVLERIALAPRQSLALVEADGRRFLVASTADGAANFYPLDCSHDRAAEKRRQNPSPAGWQAPIRARRRKEIAVRRARW